MMVDAGFKVTEVKFTRSVEVFDGDKNLMNNKSNHRGFIIESTIGD